MNNKLHIHSSTIKSQWQQEVPNLNINSILWSNCQDEAKSKNYTCEFRHNFLDFLGKHRFETSHLTWDHELYFREYNHFAHRLHSCLYLHMPKEIIFSVSSLGSVTLNKRAIWEYFPDFYFPTELNK
jgi:hypothetical protein